MNKTEINTLKKDLRKTTRNLTKILGKDLNWLRFAKASAQGYKIFARRISQWHVLGEIVEQVAPMYPQLTTGQVVDVLCELVNKKQTIL